MLTATIGSDPVPALLGPVLLGLLVLTQTLLAPIRATEDLGMSFYNVLVSRKTGEGDLSSPLSLDLLGSRFYFMQMVVPQSLPPVRFPRGR